MNPYVALAITVLYWILFPLYWIAYYLLQAIIAVLLLFVNPVSSVVLFVAQPLIFLAVFVSQLAYLPIDLIRRLETIYIYLAVGGLVGVIAGLFIHGASSFLSNALGLRPRRLVRGPNAREHRQARRRKAEALDRSSPPTPPATTVEKPDTTIKVEKAVEQDRMRLSALPKLTLQGPSPKGKRSLYDQTMEEDADSDLH
ncbi:Serine/threonine-protein kinase ppk18 [Sphaceloma murrayae]|uniref:Serine/threonine-protein kinase ppk18 n=1 Tax=Sphaceloma murrayae TaxID=2082308 RepID=A0A2K1QKR9_9PEZI|nr:Serine/threonine-protein kinase ppk18 [Sphaceloma murrayae]